MATSNTNTNTSTAGTFGGVPIATVLWWGVAAISLIALAGPFPGLATMFVTLLIVGDVLINYKGYTGLLTPP
ncbi:MAG TPA: hypothetical protein VNG51_16940 [Ktedonobacteraceae bacterium]|nr:hypothetical protein [Ktedonobacteraceae bacterium]